MSKKEKTCRVCKALYEGDKCPNCNSQEYSEDGKGKVIVLDPEKSEIAKNMTITKKGRYSIKF